jgi:hypothetical protein
MSSDSSWRREPPSFNARLDESLNAADEVIAITDRRNSFAREKFVWLDQVRADPELTPLAFMLAYVLANLVNEREGHAWPSIARLAAECRVSETSVKQVIRRLVARGHLSVELGIGRGKTNRYRWIIKSDDVRRAEDERRVQRRPMSDQKWQAGLPISERKGVIPVTPIEEKKGQSGSEKGAVSARKGVSVVPPTLFNESIYDPFYRLSPRQSMQIVPSGFDDFWRAYPKKVARTEAMRAFAQAVQRTSVTEIIRGAMRYATERRGGDPRYTKHPATWLNKHCWSDLPSSSRAFQRDGPPERSQFSRSVVAQLHDDSDFDEALARIQQQRNKRG